MHIIFLPFPCFPSEEKKKSPDIDLWHVFDKNEIVLFCFKCNAVQNKMQYHNENAMQKKKKYVIVFLQIEKGYIFPAFIFHIKSINKSHSI